MDPHRRSFLIDFLSIIFGIGAWISVNGMWVELPLLVQTLPEGWNLPSYMSIIIQLANIGPLTYSAAKTLFPAVVNEACSISIVMLIGISSSALLPIFWKATTIVGGFEHSTALLSLLFFLSIVDCTSSVLFMPYMARFPEIYLTSYLIGEGFSGLLPSILALAQGVGGNPLCLNVTEGSTVIHMQPYYPSPRFSTSDFFIILLVMMVLSAVGFFSLNRKESRLNDVALVVAAGQLDNNSEERLLTGRYNLSKSTFIYLQCLQVWICALSNGGLPSIQSYSCLPYGNTAYHLAVTLSNMANPLACCVAYFLPTHKVSYVTIWTILGTCISSYIIVLASLSPVPPLVGYTSGEVLMVITIIYNQAFIWSSILTYFFFFS